MPDSVPSESIGGTESTPIDATTTPPAPAESAVSSPTGKITGVAQGADDVEPASGGPLDGGTIAFVPSGDEVGLWSAVEFEPDDDQLATVGGLVPADAIPNAILTSIEDGGFAADPPDGDYLVCLLRGGSPWGLAGCGRMAVDGPATWVLSFGEGGVSVFAAG